MAGPQFVLCLILVAVALLLAYTASDERATSEVRERARRRLEQLPDQVLVAGLSASYADEALRFVRRFDVPHHDPALTYRQAAEFLERCEVLFVSGRIWDSVDDPSEQHATPLAMVWNAALRAKPIYYDGDGKVLHLFRKVRSQKAQDLQDAVHTLVDSMTQRIKVELSLEDLGVLFTAFDLVRWHAATNVGSGVPESAM